MTEEDKKELAEAENSETDEDIIEDNFGIEPEILKNLPPEARKVIQIGMSSHRFGPMQNPLTQKLTSQHIDKILEISEKDDERAFKDAGESRKYTLIYIILFSALFIFLTVFLVGSDVELYKEIVKLFAIFLGGLGSGFGIKGYMDRNK